jgi:uncharacterized membrane protein
MEKLKTLWTDVADSLWFVPGLLTLAGGALATVLISYNDRILGAIGADAGDVWWIFGGSAEGAKSVLESISGSIITVTGVVFSVTIIALQLASSQFTPRVLRQFMGNRANQAVLGVFIGTFTYALIVQRTVRGSEVDAVFVPAVAVTGAVVLALTSIGFLIFFIDHLARSIQASVVIDSATRSTVQVLGRVFPDAIAPGTAEEAPSAGELTRDLPGDGDVIHATQAGYLQAIDRGRLCDHAARRDLVIRMEVEPGTYVLPGLALMRVWPAGRITTELEAALVSGLVLGLERTPHQDLKHGVIELMDIAVKGMSPSINDPTTAVNAVQRLSQILLDMAWRVRGDSVIRDERGAMRLSVRRPRLDDTVDLAFNQIRHYAAGNPSVAIAMIESLGTLVTLSPAAARPAFERQLRAVIDTATTRISDRTDVERLQKAAAAALGTTAVPPPRQRPRR